MVFHTSLWFFNFIKTMGKSKKEDDTCLREKIKIKAK